MVDRSVADLRRTALRGSLADEFRRAATHELVRRAEGAEGGADAAAVWAAATLALRAQRDGRCAAFAERAVALCREAEDRANLEMMLGQVAIEAARSREYRRAVALLREAVAICRSLDNQERLAANLNSLAIYTRRTGALEDAVGLAEQGLEAARVAGARNVEGVLLNSLGAWLLELDRFAEARAVFELALERVRHPISRFVVFGGLADADLREGDPASARTKVLELLEEPHPIVTSQYLGAAVLLLARTFEAEEDWSKAHQKAVEAAEMVEQWPAMEVDARIVEAHCLRELGRPTEALELMRAIAAVARDSNAKMGVREGLAMALAATGDHEAAFDELRGVVEGIREREIANARARLGTLRASQEFHALEDRARISRAQQRIAEAEAEAERLERERAEAGERRVKRDSVLGLGALALLGLAFVAALRYRSQRKRAGELLRAEEEHRRELQAKVHESRADLRREAEERLDLARQLEAARRHEAVGQLTAGVAHDFNNLLQVLGQSSELLALDLNGHLTESQRSLFESCRQSVDTGARITSQLLSYARKQPLEPETVVVSELLENAAELFRSTVGERLAFSVRDDTNGGRIVVDPAGFTTAIINLLSNARDASSSGGAIVIEACCATPAPAVVAVPAAGSFVQVTVRDSGKGMTEEQIARACEPFYTDKEAGAGTGLGLSTVYGFVSQSRGAMTIESQVGEGTTVSFWIPMADAAAPEPTRKPEIASAGRVYDSLACMVVDDNARVRETVSQAARSQGFSVMSCSSAAEARTLLAEGTDVDLLVADVCMPGERGTELAQWLTERSPGVGVILMTGFAEDVATGAFPVLRKPFTVAEFLDAFQGVLVK